MPRITAPRPTALKTPAAALLRWYDKHRRTLPWRAPTGVRPDPYAVWLSEIMLQQTTVTAVIPYFRTFLARWPDVAGLAAAPDVEVMQAWAGLGYYARARNLLACARAVAHNHEGRFPDTEAGLRALPGIGAYTSAAIAAIAFGRRAVVVDGNVERVVSRLFAIEAPLPSSRPLIREKTDSITPSRRAGDFAQAMMDLGATICTPKNPACLLCPLEHGCVARASGDPATYPRRSAKKARPARKGAVFVLTRADGAVLVQTRPERGLLGGMSEFPGVWAIADHDDPMDAAPCSGAWESAGVVAHGFTHFDLELCVYVLTGKVEEIRAHQRWVSPAQLAQEPFPTLMQKVAESAGLALKPAVSGGARPGPESARLSSPDDRPRPPRRARRARRASGPSRETLAKPLPSSLR
jgi:A/G-specific adenine glycosylase